SEPVVEQMLNQYRDKIRFAFRQFPLVAVHPQAEKAAEASLCAGNQGKFWQAHDFLYQHPEDLTEQGLERDAATLGLNTAQFNQCLESGQEKARVQRDIDDAHALGLHATPTFFVNQHVIQGPPALADLTGLIDQELAKHGISRVQAAATASDVAKSPLAPDRNQASTSKTAVPGASPSSATAASATTPPNASGLGTNSPGAFGGSTTGVFGQLQQQSTLACSEDEAKQRQPALIHTPEVHQMFTHDPKPMFVDVRKPAAFAAGHIPGAINIPAAQTVQQLDKLPKNRVVVLYQGGRQGSAAGDICAFSRAAGRILLANGFSWNNVKVYQDGLADWQKAGYPVER
ncbi:MAG: thioredoxin domain-containing protein, partial [Terriglobia bacterium]